MVAWGCVRGIGHRGIGSFRQVEVGELGPGWGFRASDVRRGRGWPQGLMVQNGLPMVAEVRFRGDDQGGPDLQR